MNQENKYKKYENSIKKKYSNNIEIINFEDRTLKTSFKCSNNHNFNMLGRKMLERKSNICPLCEIENYNKKQEMKIKNIFKNEYTLLSSYEKNFEKVLVRHNLCNNEYYVTPNNIFGGKKCPFCSNKKQKRSSEWLKEKIIELSGDEYS